MQSSLTNSLSSAFANADEEARKLGQEFVGAEHLLLGLLDQPEAHAVVALKSQINVAELRGKIVGLLPHSRKPTGVTGRLPFSPKAQGILNSAMSESKLAGQEKVSTQFILLAILNDANSEAVSAISTCGADLDELTRVLRESANQAET